MPVYDCQATNQPDAEKEVAGLLSSWLLPARDNQMKCAEKEVPSA